MTDASTTDEPTNRYEAACESQGFEDPLDESPVEVPDGWNGGQVEQTGGMVMVRTWRTYTPRERDGDVAHEVAYGSNPGVTLARYTWDDEVNAYTWDGEVESRPVNENTDERKADVAQELMEDFDADA